MCRDAGHARSSSDWSGAERPRANRAAQNRAHIPGDVLDTVRIVSRQIGIDQVVDDNGRLRGFGPRGDKDPLGEVPKLVGMEQKITPPRGRGGASPSEMVAACHMRLAALGFAHETNAFVLRARSLL